MRVYSLLAALIMAALLLGAAMILRPASDEIVRAAPTEAQQESGQELVDRRKFAGSTGIIDRGAMPRESQTAASMDPQQDTVPGSLAGSEADGRIGFDDSGRLIVDAELRRRFDYLLSAVGEWDLDRIRSTFESQLSTRFSADRVESVMADFDLYLAYLEALDLLLPDHVELADQMAAMFELQRKLLGPERTEAMFGEENRYLERTLDILAGEMRPGDPDLDPWADEVQAATGHLLAAEMNRQYELKRIDPSLRHAEREVLFGSDAADRLAELDAERAAWQLRVAEYTQVRRELAHQLGSETAAFEQALEDYRAQHFSPAEGRRIQGMERAGLIDGGD